MREMTEKELRTLPLQASQLRRDKTIVAIVFENGKCIEISIALYGEELRIESDRRITISPSTTKRVFIS
jgi:hypothetical protein